MEKTKRNYRDTLTIAWRCLLLSCRNPETFLTSILLPALMMLLFVSLFGSLIHVGGTSYTAYIVPGVLIQCAAQGSSTTAIMINQDITSGIMSRFATLPIRRRTLLSGHVLEAYGRSLVTSAVVLLIALLMGFRPALSLPGLGISFFLLSGMILALSWLSATVGILSKSAQGASSLSSLAIILPYLSSGFVPAEHLPPLLRTFARYQPMTPVIDSMRAALAGAPTDAGTLAAALIWCAFLTVVFYPVSVLAMQKRLSR